MLIICFLKKSFRSIERVILSWFYHQKYDFLNHKYTLFPGLKKKLYKSLSHIKIWWQIVGVLDNMQCISIPVCVEFIVAPLQKSIFGANFNWATHTRFENTMVFHILWWIFYGTTYLNVNGWDDYSLLIMGAPAHFAHGGSWKKNSVATSVNHF